MPLTRSQKIMTSGDVIKRDVANIASLAAKHFADHKITLRHRSPCGKFASWRCCKTNSWIYGFDVTVEPGRLLVMGDIGFCAWERCDDMLAWCRGSIDSLAYFAEKVVRDVNVKEWSDDVARGWIAEQSRDVKNGEHDEEKCREWREVRRDLLAALEDGRVFFELEVYRSGWVDGGDFPDFSTYTPSFLWCREAAKWFLANASSADLGEEAPKEERVVCHVDHKTETA